MMIGRQLEVTVICEHTNEEGIYLSQREGLKDYFSINGSFPKESYGSISFKTTSTLDVMDDLKKKHEPLYVFIALNGSDYLSQSYADEYQRICTDGSLISYVSEYSAYTQTTIPVCVNEAPYISVNNKEIERMAYNMHLIFEEDQEFDRTVIKKRFKERYHHDASVMRVLSLKYMLYSLFIDLDEVSLKEAAKYFYDLITHENVSTALAAFEHRRFVAEKISQGWTQLKDLNQCVYGMIRNDTMKQHVAILHSRPVQELDRYSLEEWDTMSDEQLEDLDELDQLSVRLHRSYNKEAQVLRKTNLLEGDLIHSLEGLSKTDQKAYLAFQHWKQCVHDILHGQQKKVHLYEPLK